MQITVNRAELAAAVQWPARTLPLRPAAPALAGMRLEVADGRLRIAATDYETSGSTIVYGTDTRSGVMVVHGRMLALAVKSLPKSPAARVTLSGKKDGPLTIECDGTLTTVEGLPLADYPILPDLPDPSGVVYGEAFRRTAIRVAATAAADDDCLPILEHMLMKVQDGALTVVSTDRFRLGVDPIGWTELRAVKLDAQYLVPAKIVAEFAKGCTGKVQVHFGDGAAAGDEDGDGLIGFTDETRTLIVHGFHGEYPKYGRFFHVTEAATAVVVSAAELAAAVRACDAVSYDRRIKLAARPGLVTVQSFRDNEVAATRTVPATVTGDDIDVLFNPKLLAAHLSVLKGRRVSLTLNGDSKPAQIADCPEPDPYQAIIMPIRPYGAMTS